MKNNPPKFKSHDIKSFKIHLFLPSLKGLGYVENARVFNVFGRIKNITYSLLILSTIACQSTIFSNKTQEFFKAVENNQLKIVKELAPEIKDINTTNEDGITAVHLACLKGHLEIVKYLASNEKVDFDMKTKWGAQHIHFVAQGGTIEAFNYLIKEKKADIHLKDLINRTPLWLALNHKKYEIAKIILEKSTNKNFNTPHKTYNRIPLWLALDYKKYEIAKIRLERSTNKNFNIPDKTYNTTPLWIALKNEQYEIAKTILEKSTDKNFNTPKTHNITPLWVAIYFKQFDIAKIILEKSTNQNFNIPDKNYNITPLWLALFHKKYEIAKIILEKSTNKNFNIPDKEHKQTPLDILCIHFNDSESNKLKKMINLLIEKGANPNIANTNDQTPIMRIINNPKINKFGSLKGDLCEILIKNGADIYKENKDNKNAVQIAKESGSFYYKIPLHTYILKLNSIKTSNNIMLKNIKDREKPILIKTYQGNYEKDKTCLICCEKKDKTEMIAFYPCGHIQCLKCFKKSFKNKCYMCKEQIEEIEYLSKIKKQNKIISL